MSLDILVVDDDPIGGGLTNTLLQEAGYRTQLVNDSHQVLDAVRSLRPGLVILDILMPGIDGLTLCHMIKEDPAIRDTKIIMVSGKAFAAEKERALRYGANLFIEKPYNVTTLSQQIMEVIGAPAGGPRPSEPSPQPTMRLRVWGSRARGEGVEPPKTPCVSVETEKHCFIFDAGTGLLDLGEALKAQPRPELWLFLTHYHPAHLEGLGRFAPTRDGSVRLRIAGPSDPEKGLRDAVREAFEASFASWPDPVTAAIQLYDLKEGHYDLLPDVKFSSFYANHPGTTLGFQLETEGRRIVYCPDTELYGEAAAALQDFDEKLGTLCHGADLLMLDARWMDADYIGHKNEGHSQLSAAVDFAARQDVGELLLFHQDAQYTPAQLEAMEQDARAALKARGSPLSCRVARPGLSVEL